MEQAAEKIQKVTKVLAAARKTSVAAVAAAVFIRWNFCVKRARTKVDLMEFRHVSVYNGIALLWSFVEHCSTHNFTPTQNHK